MRYVEQLTCRATRPDQARLVSKLVLAKEIGMQKGLQAGLAQGIQEGIEQGAHTGIAGMLHTLLQQKFGDLHDVFDS